MRKEKRIILKVILCLIIVFSAIFISNYKVRAEEVYESLLTNNETESSSGNITYAQHVTKAMTKTSYWKNKTQSVNKVLMTIDEIKALNKKIVDNKEETNVIDLETITQPLNISTVEKYKKNGNLRQLYINGNPINQQEYITNFENALTTSKYPDGTKKGEKIFYAVVTKRADLKVWPLDEYIGYSATDPDDEGENCALNVNEPVVIRDVCNIDGKTFYYCQSKTCPGWVNSENLAICDSKEEWIDAWKIDISKKDFLVVLQDKITLEQSASEPQTSDVKLMIGTNLKLVPEKNMPQNLGERGTWNNYVVYLPTRDNNGKYVKQYALISEHYNVSIGYKEMTQANILDVAFTCLGNRYGWGGMLGAMDCSAYTQAIYKCFGLQLPRNTTWQQKVPGKVTDISKLTDSEKQSYLETIPVGSLLYFPGHTMMYVGSEEGRGYVISATGSLSDSDGDLNVRSMYSVILNPLTTRRSNQRTWLNNLTAVLTFATPEYIHEHDNETIITKKANMSENGSIVVKCKKCKKIISNTTIQYPKTIELSATSYKYTGKVNKPSVTVKDAKGNTIPASNYIVTYSNKNSKKVGEYTVTITFKENYEGSKKLTYHIKPKGVSLKKLTKGKKQFKATWTKNTTETTGYQIQYSTKKDFSSGNKKITIKKNKTTSTTINSLKNKKIYYVRIRTYKTVDGKKIYSSWSKVLNVKTK